MVVQYHIYIYVCFSFNHMYPSKSLGYSWRGVAFVRFTVLPFTTTFMGRVRFGKSSGGLSLDFHPDSSLDV